MNRATPHNSIVVLFIQGRQRTSRNRVKRDMGWRQCWNATT